MNKNVKLLIILIGLIIVSVSIALYDGSSENNDFEAGIFQVEDTASIATIRIKNAETTISINKRNGNWILNDQYLVDQNLTKILTNILAQVQVKRPVARLNNSEVYKGLITNGNQVEVTLTDGEKLTFLSGGNQAKTTSYYAEPKTEKVYIVEIPGYNNYISGIFELTKNQWRDRVLFASSWRTVKELKIDYSIESDLSIEFEDKFLKVEGVSKIDTTKLLSYLDQFEYFQINDYLEKGNYPKYDSLSNTKPLARLAISDIDNSKNRNLKVYAKMKGERFYLLTDPSDQMMVVDEKRMESILVSNNQFKSE